MNGSVLVTGGLGNLGSWISLHLAKQGFDVYILTRKEKYKLKDTRYQVVECDITNLETLKEKLNFDIDYCIHTASLNEFFLPDYPKMALEVNTLGTRNLLEVLSEKNLKNFVYFSTFHVYGASSGLITEDTVLNPKNDYAITHLFAEYYVKQFALTHSLNYTILRLTNSYGVPTHIDSDKWYLVLNDLTKSAFENNKIVLKSNGKAKRDFIYMGDVVNIVGRLLKIDATNSIYNLSSNKSYDIAHLANIVRTVYEKKYNKSIEIEINENDKNEYEDIEVKNDKLQLLVKYELTNMMYSEVENMFTLLETK